MFVEELSSEEYSFLVGRRGGPLGEVRVGEALAVVRMRVGFTVGQVSRLMGISYAQVLDMETGRRPPARLMRFWGIKS